METAEAPEQASHQKVFLDVLGGNKADRIPFWFMRQAGRYLPEYRELRQSKGGFLEMVRDPVTASEITLQPVRRFGMDAAVIFSDILVIPQALGQKLEFVDGDGPKLDPVKTASDVTQLNYSQLESSLSPVYETIKSVRSLLKAEGFGSTATLGFAGAPWTVACYMVEGGSSRDFIDVKTFAYSDPAGFASLIDLLVEATASYLVNQINAGAEAVQIFDSWAGILDIDLFRKWVIEPTRQIVDLVRDSHPHIPVIGFPRGAGQNTLAYVQDTGVTAVGIDSQVSTKWAAQALQSFCPVQGNLDPVCLMAGGDALKLAAERIIGDLSGGPFIFNLGHGVHKDTPPENVQVLVDFIRSGSQG